MKEPQRRHHRQRAHSNPFSDHDITYPLNPSMYNASKGIESTEIVDIGCGYGGLLFALAEVYTDKRILGMEIRNKVVEYVAQKIAYKNTQSTAYKNVSVVRTNSMKFLANYVEKGTVEQMYILFPDPHYKKKKHKARIVSEDMLDVYYYVLKEGGRLYISTDVEELYKDMVECIEAHSALRRIEEKEAEQDAAYEMIVQRTEESKKADMKQSRKYRAIYEKAITKQRAASQ